MRLAFDATPSVRSYDDNGFMRVASSHITKATVNPYYGREIPGWRELKLDPEKIYYGLRDPRELQKSVSTWEGLPLHIEHHPDSADDPEIRTRVGAVGKAAWANPYVDASLTVWNKQAIDAINDGSFRELSCAYRYVPDFTPGAYEGVDYDFVMRNIRGNHVALVEEGRAGPDVLVADAALDGKEDREWRTAENGKKYELDTESGEITKGNLGQEIKINGDELGAYSDIKELRKKAVEYYKANFQGKNTFHRDIGEIKFTGKGRKETIAFSADPDKLLIIPFLPDILKTGKLGEEESLKHPRKDGITSFIPIKNNINLKGKSRDVEVLIGKDENGNLYYDLFLDGKRGKESQASNRKQIPGPAGDSYEREIAPQYEVVNIRFADESPAATANDAKQKSNTGGFMRKLKNWFKGAKDANPDIEREEVDLAQAIIDLHKVDPQTGEIVDITEDEDKAKEIRKIVGEVAGKLDPEELKKLTDALGGLAYSKATGDSEAEKKTAMDEETKKAMDKCGIDADDPELSAAFAEGVKYGESLERDPAEREKLDREHEANGMKKAMDACGVDSENPQESRAFAEGVKYGESVGREPKGGEKKDAPDASGEKKAADSDKSGAIAAILDKVPNLTAEQRKPLEASLLALFAPDGAVEIAAQDRALRPRAKNPRPLMATDAAVIQARAVAAAQDNMRKIATAIRDVRPLVGDLDMLAFDSATEVYGYALEQCGINRRDYDKAAGFRRGDRNPRSPDRASRIPGQQSQFRDSKTTGPVAGHSRAGRDDRRKRSPAVRGLRATFSPHGTGAKSPGRDGGQ
ncbi:MAG: DUF2213 domain-containing protein [Desulfovibrio sp.]|nr:DUF2213 domain-containing protein [Desulfovibrio sp.]